MLVKDEEDTVDDTGTIICGLPNGNMYYRLSSKNNAGPILQVYDLNITGIHMLK